jgi:hypothetical protein
MEWLIQNWTWVAGAALIVFFIYLFTRKPRKRGLTDAEAKRVMNALIDALENVVDDTIGQLYSRQDRQKIALGMIAVMAAEHISLEQLISSKTLFASVMAKSVAALTRTGQIVVR